MGKKIALTKAVLFMLEKTVDGYCRFEDFTYHHYRYRYGYPNLKKSDLAQALKRLREDGFITQEKNEEEIIFKLTQQGKDRAMLFMDEKDIEWDGKWRLVIFDIPEKRRSVRVVLRRKLLDWGFRKWQKSVWASKKNCTGFLREFIKQVGIEDWVLVIESGDVGDGFHTN